jgi:acyl-CoA thioesterase YciA
MSQPTLQVMVRPTDINISGDTFGGFIMSQADMAASILSRQATSGRVVTRAVNSFEFLKPSYLGNVLSFYTGIEKVGNTSITIGVKVYALDISEDTNELISVSSIVFVAVNDDGSSREHTASLF